MNPPLSVCLYTRDFSGPLNTPGWQVDSCAWRLPGGPHTAELSAPADAAAVAVAAGWLRCPLVLSGAGGAPVWWGYVESVGLSFGALDVERSLQGMATRLRVRGFELRNGLLGAEPLQTAWAEDSAAAQRYGVMEAEVQAGAISAAQAEGLRALLLERLAQPQRRVRLHESQPPGLRLLARGWWATLGWRLAQRSAGRVEHTATGNTFQPLGAEAANAQLAMPLTVGEGGWRAEEVGLRLRKRGAPADALFVELCADAGGAPGAVLAAAQFAASTLPGEERWLYAPFNPTPALSSGATVWLVLQRGGAVDAANHYRVQVDESGGYARGLLRLGTGATWSLRAPAADLNFRVAGGQPNEEQIAVLADAQHGGAWMSGVDLPGAPARLSSPYRGGERTCLQEIEELLESGSADGQAYSAQITPDRRLVVELRPSPDTAIHRLGSDGIVRDAFGRPARLEAMPLGRWAELDAPWDAAGGPVFLLGARWDGQALHWEV